MRCARSPRTAAAVWSNRASARPDRDYGKYGLKDAGTGTEVVGFSRQSLTASPEEIEDFLREAAVTGWKKSLGKAKPKRG